VNNIIFLECVLVIFSCRGLSRSPRWPIVVERKVDGSNPSRVRQKLKKWTPVVSLVNVHHW